MVNQCTIFEVSRFTRYEAMNGGANAENGVVMGMPPLDIARTTSYSTLLETLFILYRFRDIASYLSKFADFDPPHLHLVPS